MKAAMFIILASITSLAFLWLLIRAIRHKSLYPLLSLKHNFGKRRDSFRKTLELLSRRHVKVMVETGTARLGFRGAKSNGASTLVFASWARINNAILHSVDNSPESIGNAKSEVDKQGLNEYVKWHQQDSLIFLADFEQAVDFLYLDSFDYHKQDTAIQLASQQHHLAEFKAIESRLHQESLVLIDDCALPNGGKGKLVIEYMLERKWKILLDDYQVLLGKSTQYEMK